MTACSLYVTTGSREEADAVAHAVISERLAACANIIEGVTSVYRWEGEVQQDTECLVIMKTRQDLVDDATRAIKAAHGYDCPCIVALPIIGGNGDYLDWIIKETR